jgi:O-acetyl-ADP-ribose deacetylase (regulator of RNase III)
VIVVCSSSDGLRESVLQAAGSSIQKAYEKKNALATESDTFSLRCRNLPCKEIFFLEWTPSNHIVLNEETIKQFISKAMAYVLSQNYRSVAFPSIGCGQFGLDPAFIAQTMINYVRIEKYPLNVVFIIHPQSHHVFNAFQNANGRKKNICQTLFIKNSWETLNRFLCLCTKQRALKFSHIDSFVKKSITSV